MPVEGEIFTLECGASEEAVVGVPSQSGRLIKLFSRKSLDLEKVRTVVEKEQLTIQYSLKAFRSTIGMTQIVILTDNKNLVYLDNNSNRTLKFESFLMNFNFEIKNISGHSN